MECLWARLHARTHAYREAGDRYAGVRKHDIKGRPNAVVQPTFSHCAALHARLHQKLLRTACHLGAAFHRIAQLLERFNLCNDCVPLCVCVCHRRMRPCRVGDMHARSCR